MSITITTVIKDENLRQYSHDLAELIKVVRAANGRYVLYVDTVKSATTQSAFISKSEFDNAISPTMYGSPSAFSQKLAGGKFLPHRLNAAYGAYTRAQAQAQTRASSGTKVIRNRAEYLAIYRNQFDLFPNNRIGQVMNGHITNELQKG